MNYKKTSLKCPVCLKTRIVDKYEAGKICYECNLKILSKGRSYIDISGKTFGKLRALTVAYTDHGKYCWNCICDCGKSTIVEGNRLRSGWTKSCGCLSNKLNGLSKVKSYHIWRTMIQRCYDKDSTSYKNYGARGIKVCDRWLESFLNFYEDMGERPKDLTLDRINSNDNYSKDNCRWTTWKNQASNRRNTVFIEAFGEKKLLTDWAKEKNIKSSTLRYRLKKGWSSEKSLTRKVQ